MSTPTEFADQFPEVSRKWVTRFLLVHRKSQKSFDAEFGHAESYATEDVLAWAGY